MADLARLTEVIEPEATALGFELVRVKMMPSEAGDGAQALQIMAEDPKTRPSFDTLHSMIERLVNATSLAESWDLAMDDLLDA